MKKIIFSGVIFMSLFVISCCFGADETVASPGKPLTVEEFTGKKDAYLEPTMFPRFYDYVDGGVGDTTSECIYALSKKNRWTSVETVEVGIWGHNSYPYQDQAGVDLGTRINIDCSLKIGDDCNYSNGARYKGEELFRGCDENCSNIYKPCKENGWEADGLPKESEQDLAEGEYQAIPGLSGIVETTKGYRNITKILFTWTVRLEASSRILAVWPYLCSPFHATVSQEFLAGPLKTRLYAKSSVSGNGIKNADTGSYVVNEYVPLGQVAEMTVPSSGKGMVRNIGDPTITGSYVLLPTDFAEGRVPEEVYFEVRWYNETSMRIKSPKNQRNLVVTVFPITDQKE